MTVYRPAATTAGAIYGTTCTCSGLTPGQIKAALEAALREGVGS